MSRLVALTLRVPDRGVVVDALTAHGFDVDGDALRVGEVEIAIVAGRAPHGLVDWTFLGDTDAQLRLDPSTVPPTYMRTGEPVPAEPHPNGARHIDHIVVMVPRLETTVAGLQEFVGVDLRRRTDIKGMPAAFLRAGEVVLEVIELRSLPGPRLWGIALAVDDAAATAAVVRERGGRVSDPTASLQGGRIAQLPGDLAGMTLAFMEPAPATTG